MSCFPLRTSTVTGMVCTGRQRRSKCSTAGCGHPVEVLCDYPVTRKGEPTTCSAKLCAQCRVRKDDKTDYCPPHERLAAAANSPRLPVRGDVRRHETGARLWVVSLLDDPGGNGEQLVTFARNLPDDRGRCAGVLQTVPLEKWRAKTTPAPATTGRCRGCDGPIGWCKTAEGKNVPLDAEPHPDGNIVIDQEGIALYAQRGSFPVMYLSHFATCPNAERFRRKKD